jgi:hypothetical protein
MAIMRLIETSTESVKEETKAIEATINKLAGMEELYKYWKTLVKENWLKTKRISLILLKHMENIANKKKDMIDYIYAKVRTDPERLVINLVTLRDVLNEDSTTWQSAVSAPVSRLQSSTLVDPAPLPPPSAQSASTPRPARGGGVKTRKKRRRRRKRRKILTKNNKNKNKN